MAVEVKMPQLGLTMEEGTVSKWVKQEGDAVKVGDVLLEITTDKLTSEVTAEAEGTLIKIVAQEGEDIPVKGLLAYIGEVGEQPWKHGQYAGEGYGGMDRYGSGQPFGQLHRGGCTEPGGDRRRFAGGAGRQRQGNAD